MTIKNTVSHSTEKTSWKKGAIKKLSFYNCSIFYRRIRTFSIGVPARNKCHQKAIRFLLRSVDVIYKLWYNLLFVASIVGDPLDTLWEWKCCFDFHAHLISTFPFPLAFLSAVCLLLLLKRRARTHRLHRFYQFQGERIRQTMNTLTSSIANSFNKENDVFITRNIFDFDLWPLINRVFMCFCQPKANRSSL